MRRFTFLSCVGCKHFRPKRLLPGPGVRSLGGAYVGVCAADTSPEWVVWKSLEWAVQGAGRCPDRQSGPDDPNGCNLFDCTAESGKRPYPEKCVYHASSVCPLAR